MKGCLRTVVVYLLMSPLNVLIKSLVGKINALAILAVPCRRHLKAASRLMSRHEGPRENQSHRAHRKRPGPPPASAAERARQRECRTIWMRHYTPIGPIWRENVDQMSNLRAIASAFVLPTLR